MTPKELMYIEDSLGMEEQMKVKCNDYVNKIQDASLKTILNNMASEHQKHFTTLLSNLNQ